MHPREYTDLPHIVGRLQQALANARSVVPPSRSLLKYLVYQIYIRCIRHGAVAIPLYPANQSRQNKKNLAATRQRLFGVRLVFDLISNAQRLVLRRLCVVW